MSKCSSQNSEIGTVSPSNAQPYKHKDLQSGLENRGKPLKPKSRKQPEYDLHRGILSYDTMQ
jgi:hypothetical protein